MDRVEQIKIWQTWLAEQGIMSFPLFGIMNGQCRCKDGAACQNAGKHPKVKGWRTITSPSQVGALDNLGISTDSLVIIDIDSADTPPSDLPETFTVSTGRGLHLWYWGNPEHPIRNAAGWRPKIDIRSVGGLAAAPPSQHVSGAVYTYLGGDIQPVPDIVIESREKYTHRERREQVTQLVPDTLPMMEPLVLEFVETIENAGKGERNHTFFRMLCRYFELAETGLMGEDALWQLTHAAERIGLEGPEILATIDSASRSLTR